MVLKRTLRPPRDLAFSSLVAKARPWRRTSDVVRAAVEARVLDDMAAYLEEPKKVLCPILGAPESTAHRLIRHELKLDAVVSERVIRVTQVVRTALEVFGGRQAALRWLKRANLALAGATPLSRLHTGFGAAEVRRILSSITYGGAY